MSHTAEQYRRQLQALLPTGPAVPRDGGAVLTALLDALAREPARVEGRGAQLVDEADPRFAEELLPDWERVAGLPNPCLADPPDTTQERRAALVAKLTLAGRQDEQYFIDLAAALGYTITITYPAAHTFQVNAPSVTVRESTCLSPCTEPLRTWGNEELECAITTLKPAHTAAQFAYS